MNSLMTIMELREFLHISRSKAYQIIKIKDFPVIRIGKSVRVDKEKLLNWLHNQKNML